MNDIEPKPKSRRWTRILLAVSLGLNLAVVGAFIGAQVSDRRGPPEVESVARGQLMGPYGRAFSKEDRAALRKAFVSRSQTLRQKRGEMRAIAEELVATVRAVPFDGEAVRAVLGKQRDVQISLQDEGQDILIQRLSEMTPAARAQFAENLEKGLKRGRKRR